MLTYEGCIGVLAGFLSPLIIYIICSKLFGKTAHKKPLKESTSCHSKDCVRCNAYDRAKTHALERLDVFKFSGNHTFTSAFRRALNEHPIHQKEDQQPSVFYLKYLQAKPWWTGDIRLENDMSLLQIAFNKISDEFLSACDQYPTGWNLNESDGGAWAVFHLINQGEINANNCMLCPETTRVIQGLEGSMLKNVFGNALFSILVNNTHITPHCGPTNIRIRCQLGVQVENPSRSTITVGGSSKTWRQGRCLAFDDSFVHEVYHHGGSQRGVLIIDMWHPDLPAREREILGHLFKP